MITKKHYITVAVIIAILLANFLIFFKLSSRDIVYEVNFSNTQKDDKIQVNGLVKTYELKANEDGTIAEIENWTMTKDEIDIKIKAPENIKDYSKLIVEAEFQNPDNPTLEVGIRRQVDYKLAEPSYKWNYNFLDNHYLNEYKRYLGKDWTYLEDKQKGVTVFQRQVSHNSVDAFLSNPPTKTSTTVAEVDEFGTRKLVNKEIPQISALNYALEQKFDLTGLEKNDESEENTETITDNYTRIPFTFRGNIDLFVYYDSNISNQLEISFIKQDRNAVAGIDQYEIKVFDYNNELVYYKIMDDDGIADDSKIINMQNFSHKIPLKKSGGYLVQFVIHSEGNDGLIRNIEVNMPNALLNNFLVGDREGFLADNLLTKPMTFYATKGTLNINPARDSSSQNVNVNGSVYFVDNKDNKSKEFRLTKDINEISTTDNDLVITHNNNFVAIKKESLFDMYPNPASEFSIKDFSEDINFLITSYLIPTIKENFSINSQEFNIKNVYLDKDGFMQMKIRAQGIEGYSNTINVKKINIKLSK